MRTTFPLQVESYYAIFDASESAIFILDWDSGAILDVNRKGCEAFGYSIDEMRKLSADNIGSGESPYTRAEARQYVALAREDRCPPFEWHRRNKDGSLYWDEVSLKPVVLAGQRLLLAVSQDITERKLAVDQLKAREEQYRMIFETSSDGMFLWDENLRVVDVNPAALALYKIKREELVGFTYSRDLPPDHVNDRYRLLRRSLAGETVHAETRGLRLDGTSFDADLRILPSTHRNRPHALLVVRDIGERRQRERELQRSEARLRATVEAAFDCVIAIDQQGKVVEFNASAERVFGYPREQAIGRPLAELILPERHRAAHQRGLAHFEASGRGPMVGRLVETTACRADGSEFPVELAISVAAVPEGNIFVGHLRDISARRAAEAERSALEGQLRQAQKMEAIGQLTGGIAHDFNNILTSVVGYVVMAQERAQQLEDAILKRQLGEAHLASQRARDLISQMLAFARRQKGDPRPLELAPLVRQTLRLLRSTLPSSVALEAQWMDADGAGEPAWVLADPVQLEQILFNLCINARDAMEGTGRINVSLAHAHNERWQCASCRSAVNPGPWVALRIADTGRGIPPEALDRIFDPFFSTKAPGQGSGMGLAMVHGIVHDHQGHVIVENSPDGAAFTVLLPSADAARDRPAAARAEPVELSPADVLVVEDDPFVGNYLREQLSGWGLRTHLIRDPAEAERWLASSGNAVDVLLTDLTMPGMTGVELAVRTRDLRPGLPILLLTGHGAELDERALHAQGISRVLRKPPDPGELRAALQAAIERRAQAAGASSNSARSGTA